MGASVKPSEKFAAWLKDQLETGTPGERLPTDDQLAKAFGVSKSTVRRVVGRYHADGSLCRIQGKGTFLAQPEGEHTSSLAPAKSSAQNVADHLLDSIHSGVLRRGQLLPPVKQMVHQLRISAATVQKAYGILQQKGVAAKTGRTYRVGGFMDVLRPNAAREITLFCPSPSDFARLFKTDDLAQAYGKMERELLANGFVLRFETLQGIEARLKAWRRLRQLPHGIIVWLVQVSDFEGHRGIWRRIVHVAGALGQPAPRLLVDGGGLPLTRRPKGMHLIARGNIVTTTARALAQYLVQRRWREANFFARPSEAFTIPVLAKARSELKHLDAGFVFRIVAVPRAGSRESPGGLARRLTASLSQPITSLILAKYERVPSRVLFDEISVFRNYGEVYARLPKARMWVFTRDEQAAAALEWANGSQIDVPRELSLISSEHDLDFYHLGLTCCFPDYEQIGYQMAHALIGDIPVTRTSKGYLRSQALLVDQLTTRPLAP